MKIMLIGLLAVVALLSDHAATAETLETNAGAAAFARLQSLVGEWEAPLPKNEVMKNVFRPIAFGTALAHEEWKNGEQTNLDTHPLHFRSTTWHLASADRLVQDWEAITPGKEPKVVRMDFKRKINR